MRQIEHHRLTHAPLRVHLTASKLTAQLQLGIGGMMDNGRNVAVGTRTYEVARRIRRPFLIHHRSFSEILGIVERCSEHCCKIEERRHVAILIGCELCEECERLVVHAVIRTVFAWQIRSLVLALLSGMLQRCYRTVLYELVIPQHVARVIGRCY